MLDFVKIFAPATVANVSCGFDSIGFAVDNMGDEMTFSKTSNKGITIKNITGAQGLSLDPFKNVAGVVALAMLKEYPVDFGIVSLRKQKHCEAWGQFRQLDNIE